MFKYIISFSVIITILLSSGTLTAQPIKEPVITNTEWEQPYQPFRIAGDLYYVGTYDLACYLIVTTKGNILINTGVASSAKQIEQNIQSLGFKLKDVKILLNTQAHYDHLGAMAAIKKQTGGRMMINAQDNEALASGGSSDYALGHYGRMFAPVKADKLLNDGDTIRLGETKLVMLHHPGHTKGSCSFMLDTKDSLRQYKVLIANMPSIVTDKKFSDITSYPTIAKDYANTLSAMKQLQFDIWVASHASQFDLHDKHKPGDAYNPAAFMDKAGYDKALEELQQDYDEHLKKQ